MKQITFFIVFSCFVLTLHADTPDIKHFTWPTDLKYDFMPKQKMTFVNGVVKNTEATALFDIDAQYSKTVMVDGITFNLPGEICEASAACYKADFNGDKIPDYLILNVKVMNGRFCGRSDVAVYVSNTQKKYNVNVFECDALHAVQENGVPMLVKYEYSDDETSFIRQVYRFERDGFIRLHHVNKFSFKR